MSITVTLNGTPYTVPEDGDTYAWGAPLTSFFQAIGNEMLQKNTALFPVSQNLDFGTSFGLVIQYTQSHNAQVADSGIFRLANGEVMAWRNAADNDNVTVGIGATDELEIDGNPISGIMVIDNLTSSSTTAALSANQGRILNDLITSGGASDGLTDVVIKSNIEKTGGDYPINDQLMLSEAMVNKVKVTGTITSDYTSTDIVVVITMDNTPPATPFILQVYDPTAAGTTDLVYIDSVNSGTHPGAVTYDCADIGNTYLAVDVPVVTNSGLQIAGQHASFDETLNANDAKDESWHITKARFKIAPFGADMDWSQRAWGISFPVESTTATTIVLTDEAASAAASHRDMFLSGDKIFFHVKLWNGRNFDPVYDSTMASNYKEITLTANATWATDQITLTHASGDNNHALTTTDFFVSRKSFHFLYSAKDGSSTETASEPTVDEFFPISRSTFGTFSDDFNRGNENPVATNGWTESSPTTAIVSNKLNLSDTAGNQSHIYRTLEGYTKSNMPIEVHIKAQRTSANSFSLFINYGVTGAGQTATNGIGVWHNDSGNQFEVFENTVNLSDPFPFTNPSNGDFVEIKVQFHRSKILLKAWNTTLGESEPNTFQEHDNDADFVITGDRFGLGTSDSATAQTTEITLVDITPVDQGFITRGTVAGLTATEQITTYSRLERNDTKDRSIVFQRDAKLKET